MRTSRDETADPAKQLTIRVLFFGAAREVVDKNPLPLTLKTNERPTVASAFQQLVERHPELERFGRSLLFAVNQEYATLDTDLKDQDELAIFPPVSGGSDDPRHDFFELTTEPIDVGSVARRVVLPECGATVTLDGFAREWTKGKRTNYLIYEAYDGMAISEMQRLGAEAHKRFDIAHIGIVHRTGRLEIGETSVVISVSAPHRKAAFEACEWAIRELKRTVPIWKKEVYADGETWVGPQMNHR
jgi:molybdopterin converting factor subunit 1